MLITIVSPILSDTEDSLPNDDNNKLDTSILSSFIDGINDSPTLMETFVRLFELFVCLVCSLAS